MRYTFNLIIMAAIVAAGLMFNPFVGLALLLGAILAVALTTKRYAGSSGQNLLDGEDEVGSYKLDDHVGFYKMDNCTCGNRKMASEPQCYACSSREG
jgi:hypothetical protein